MIVESGKFASFRLKCSVVCTVVVLYTGAMGAAAQVAAPPEGGSPRSLPQVESAGEGAARTYTIHVASREVVVDVVALGANAQPVSDLGKNEFQVFEVGKEPKRLLRRIVAFRAVDPASDEDSGSTASGGFRIGASAGCAMRFTRHYRIAFNPTPHGWTGGKHEVVITTSRPDVTLAYNSEYYVGITSPPAKPKVRSDKAATDALAQAACGGRAAVPPSIGLNTHLIRTKDSDPLRISVVVQPDSLPFLSLANGARRVALDYGACTFDADGKALAFVNRPVERVLTAEDYAQAMASGFPNLIELPRAAGAAMVRFVVMDRATGNLGFSDVVTAGPTAMGSKPGERVQPRNAEAPALVLAHQAESNKMLGGEAPGIFGSIVPDPGAMCGDVYELPAWTPGLPDYWKHHMIGEPVGAIYTDSLKVPYEAPDGIASVTSRTEWFGIDYHGRFWIQTAGKYLFRMYSDNGAELFIDDGLVIPFNGDDQWKHQQKPIELTAGIHTIHVPYFQGTGHVGLILLVQVPGGAEKVFHLQDFRPPAKATSAGGGKPR